MTLGAGGIRVLLVEDNPGDARLLRESLAEAPATQFEIVHVGRLSEAIKTLVADRFDVVLLDLGLPDGNGIETLLRARESAPGCPIVVLTGLEDETLAVQMVQAGAQDYLIKGQVGAALLVRALRYAIERVRRDQGDILRRNQTTHLWRSLFSTLGRGASAVLYRGGINAGLSTYDLVKQVGKPRSEDELLRGLRDYLRAAGLCNVQTIEIDRKAPGMTVRVAGNFETAQHDGKTQAHSCHFLRGILCGTGSRLLDIEGMVCDEVACEATGSEACEFYVHPAFS